MHTNLPDPGGGKIARQQDHVRNVKDLVHPALVQSPNVPIKVH
jgi:hypothetical protein